MAELLPQIGRFSVPRFERSDELSEIATALSAAQGEFEAVAKGSDNPFFKSKYAALPDVVKAASPILTAHGLSVSQLLGHDDGGDTLTTILLHKSGQFIADTMRLLSVPDNKGNLTPQAQGSATTYGRRYAYMAILGLVADVDDDANAASGTAPPRAPARKPRPRPLDTGEGSPALGDFLLPGNDKPLKGDA